MTTKKTYSRFFVRIPPVFYLILLFAVSIAVLSIVSYRQESQSNIENKKEELSAIARLKVKQIETWRSERLIDAGFIGRNVFFQRDLEKLNRDPKNVFTRSDIRSWLLPITFGQDYKDILILSENKNILLSVVGMDHVITPQENKNISDAISSGNTYLSDLYLDYDRKASMDLVIPFFENAEDPGSQLLGLVLLKIDPNKKLYPLIQTWPSGSKTSESLVVEKTPSGDSIIYLNELRHKSNTAFRIKYSLNDTAIAAVKAIRGKEGIIEAMDYRDKKVIAVSNKIPGTNWYMITKTDRSEITEPLDGVIKWFVLFIGLLFIASVVAALFISNRKVMKDLKTVNQLLVDKTAAEEKFRMFFDNSTLAMSLTDIDGTLSVNRAFSDMLGYEYKDIQHINMREITHPDDIERSAQCMKMLLNGDADSDQFEKRYIHKNGNIVWTEINTSVQREENGKPLFFITSVNNITDQKSAQDKIRESEEKFSKAFHTSPNAITITNPSDGKIIDVNESFCTITGYNYDEVHEHTTIDLNLWVKDDDRKFVVDALSNNSKVNALEFLFRHKTGKIITGLFSADLIQIQGKTYIISTISDITAKKEAEKAFRDIGQRFYSVLSNFVLGILMVNEDGFVEYANAEYCRQFDLEEKPEQLIGLSSLHLLEKVLPAYKEPEAIMKRISDVLSENVSLFNEEVELKNGHHYLVDFVPINVDGERQGRLWIHKDISERVQMEKLLKESESHYRLLVENQNEGLGIVDFNENFVFVNPAGEKIFGVEPGTLIGRNLNEFISKENNAIVFEETEKRKRGEDSKYDLWINTADGSKRCLSVSASPFFNNEGVLSGTFGVFQDITQQRNAEEVLKASEDKFRTLFETMVEGVSIHRMVKDKKGKYCDYIIEDANPAFEKLTGISIVNAVGSNASELYGVVPPPYFEEYGNVATTGKSFRFQTYFAPIEKHFDISVFSPRKDWFVTVFLDITDQKKIEEQIILEKNTAQQYLDVAGVMLVVLDKQGKVVLINKKGNEFLGYEEGELLGADWFTSVVPPERADSTKDVFQKLMKGSVENVAFYENPLKTRNGDIRQFAFHNIILRDDKEEIVGTLSSGEDITDQKIAASKIQELNKTLTEKNEELEQVIFVASHDLRSPLVNIQGFSTELSKLNESLFKKMENENDLNEIKKHFNTIVKPEIKEAIDFIGQSASKMNSLIGSLLRASRLNRTEVELAHVNINFLLLSVVATFEFQIKKVNAKIDFSKLPDCIGDENLLDQAFSNLLSNALKFTVDGRQPVIRFSGTENESEVIYCVEDNGQGFSEAHSEKIFALFHRLDNDTEGDGLGLAIVKKIAEKHGGRAWVETKRNKGSKFYFSILKQK